MKLGFVSAVFPDLTLPEVLQVAQETGYAAVELMCWPVGEADRRYAGVTHVDVVNLTSAEADRINNQVTEAGIEISALGYYPNPLSPDRQESEQAVMHLRQVIVATGPGPWKIIGLGFLTFGDHWLNLPSSKMSASVSKTVRCCLRRTNGLEARTWLIALRSGGGCLRPFPANSLGSITIRLT